MTETLTESTIAAAIEEIISNMDILDDPTMQGNAHGIDFYCMAQHTRNSLRLLADKLNHCELEEASAYHDGLA